MTAATVHAITPLSWSVIIGAALLALLSGYLGVQVWNGRRIVPWTPVEAMDKLRVLAVTFVPVTVMWTAGLLIGIATRIGAHLRADPGRVAVDIVVVLLGLVALAAFGVAMSLFFFTKPRRFVPLRYRSN